MEFHLGRVDWIEFVGVPAIRWEKASCALVLVSARLFLRLHVSQEAVPPGSAHMYDISLDSITAVMGKRFFRLRSSCSYWVIVTRQRAGPVRIRCQNRRQQQLLLDMLMVACNLSQGLPGSVWHAHPDDS